MQQCILQFQFIKKDVKLKYNFYFCATNSNMAEENRMEKVNMSKEFTKLSGIDQYFVRKLEQMNKDRAKEMKALRRKNWLTGLVIGTGVFSIYFYTIYAVRQERFLQDFDKVPDKK